MIQFSIKTQNGTKSNNLIYMYHKKLLDYFYHVLFFVKSKNTYELLALVENAVSLLPLSGEKIYIVNTSKGFKSLSDKGLEKLLNELNLPVINNDKKESLLSYCANQIFGKYIVAYSKEAIEYQIIADLVIENLIFYRYGRKLMEIPFSTIYSMEEEELYSKVYQEYMNVPIYPKLSVQENN